MRYTYKACGKYAILKAAARIVSLMSAPCVLETLLGFRRVGGPRADLFRRDILEIET